MKVSLHVGINEYDRSFYGGNVDLAQCVFDAHRFLDFSDRRKFVPSLMTDKLATVGNFKSKMSELAKTLKKGDTLFLTLSQHGTFDDYIPMNSTRTKRMTAMCFHDGILWDFEFRDLLKKFKSGVLVVKVSDSCFAESNWRYVSNGTWSNMGIKARFTRPTIKDVPTPTQGDKRQIRCKYFDYASSSVYQVSYEDKNGGVFSTAILSALQKDPILTYYQLWRRASELIAPNYPQTPIFENVRCSNYTGLKFLDI